MKNLSGPERAAIVVLGLGEDKVGNILSKLDEDEVRIVSQAMAALGNISAEVVEDTYAQFTNEMTSIGSVLGSYDSTEKLLRQALDNDQVELIMEELRGPAGRTMWDKLANVNEEVLSSYLKNEYPQTVAVILSKMKSGNAAAILKTLPETFSMEVVMRMINMESVQKEILDDIEKTLRTDFMSNLSRTQKRDPYELMADVFNNFDRSTEAKFLDMLEERNKDATERIKALMFTFEDIKNADQQSIQTILRVVDKDKLTIAMKGASEDLKDLFFSNMSERAAKLMKEDMEAMGPVKLKEVDEAQSAVVNTTKDLIDKGEVTVASGDDEDELIY